MISINARKLDFIMKVQNLEEDEDTRYVICKDYMGNTDDVPHNH